MKSRTWIGWALAGAAVIGAAATAGIYARAQQEIKVGRDRLARGGQVVGTTAGPVEYAEAAQGAPILLVHGAGGGYDQGLILAEVMLGDGFRTIAVSRFGYVGSPLPADGSTAAQADAYAALLDQLGIQRAAVVAISAGGPWALQFAQRHPDRVAAMVLVSAISGDPETDLGVFEDSRSKQGAFERVLQSDTVFWLISKVAQRQLVSLFGVPVEVQDRLGPRDRAWLAAYLEWIHPISLRMRGIRNEWANHSAVEAAGDLSQISAPTLVVHAVDDTLIPVSEGRHSAATIPGARYIEQPDGGHLHMRHHDEVGQEIQSFLSRQTSDAGAWMP
jgi:pimeloyl-ACP methyl ester carboxylesterase